MISTIRTIVKNKNGTPWHKTPILRQMSPHQETRPTPSMAGFAALNPAYAAALFRLKSAKPPKTWAGPAVERQQTPSPPALTQRKLSWRKDCYTYGAAIDAVRHFENALGWAGDRYVRRDEGQRRRGAAGLRRVVALAGRNPPGRARFPPPRGRALLSAHRHYVCGLWRRRSAGAPDPLRRHSAHPRRLRVADFATRARAAGQGDQRLYQGRL